MRLRHTNRVEYAAFGVEGEISMIGSNHWRLSIAICGVVLLLGCGTPGPTAPDVSFSASMLTQALRDGGATVAVGGTEPQDSFPFFSIAPQEQIVNGETVHVFEYSTPAKAASDQAKVTESGTPVGTVQVTWIEPPRFYQKGRIIVLYVGHSDDVSRRLEMILGRPFAGARN